MALANLSEHQMDGMNPTIAHDLRNFLNGGVKDNLTAGFLAKRLIQIVSEVTILSKSGLKSQEPHIADAVRGLSVDFDHIKALLHSPARGCTYTSDNINKEAVEIGLSYEYANRAARITGYGEILTNAAEKLRDRMVDLVAKVLYPGSQAKEFDLVSHMKKDSRRLDALHPYFQEILSNGHFRLE